MPAATEPRADGTFAWSPDGPDTIVLGDNLAVTALLPDASFRLIYLDPPFNTGRVQRRQSVSTTRSPEGARVPSPTTRPRRRVSPRGRPTGPRCSS